MTDEELLQVIEQAAADGREELDLRSKGLRSLPPEIGQLKELQSLNLWNNQLSTLPAEIAQLTNLQSLYLWNNQLSTLPAEIVQLTNLQSLDLKENQLSTLPAEIVQLTKLQSLELTFNQLNTLPAEIAQLTNLQSLDLRDNQLSTLPAEIVQLTNLQSLDLSDNQLSTLPSEIAQLTNLQSLNLRNNQLSTLPAEIAQLTNLQSLDLSENQLSTLPSEIAQLTNLQSLDLWNNQLSTLPSEIAQLINLQSLDLRFNQLSTLPSQIKQVPNLEILDLRGNPVPIPPEILGDKDPWELRTGNITEILDFYFRIQDPTETEPLYEAKFLIVGEGGAGKTSLAKKIEAEAYELQPDEESTEGINVIRWDFQLPNGQPFRVNIWDFGGQEIYHQTHQFFLTERSLYALVLDTRKDNTDLHYWLKVIELLSDNSPVLIIKNEKQNRQCEINERQLHSDFLNIKEVLATNLADNSGLTEIKDAIQTYITRLPHVGTPLPKLWVRVRAALENDRRNTITQDEYLQICRANYLTDKKDALFLSRYLHDLGVCLHFQTDPILKHTLILKPEWATTAVYNVLDTDTVKQHQGCFTQQDLDTIWEETEYADYRDELLYLMMRFKLCYEISGRPQHYIAPHLLSVEEPDYDWDSSENLILRYEYDFMPKGILTRFIVELHRVIENQTLVWKNGVVLNNSRARAEILEYYRSSNGEIRIRVSSTGRKELLNIINHEFKQIHDSYERLKYNTLIPCNCDRCTTHKPHEYTLAELERYLDRKRPTIECRESFDQVNIRRLIDDVLPNTLSSQKPKPKIQNLQRDSVFISYSHQDKAALKQLQTHLKPLIRKGSLQIWDDTQIQPGDEWRKEIEAAIASAKVAVLLVSPDFLASDFIAENEIPPLLNAAESEGLTIIWIPYRASGYEHTEIANYQAAHNPQQPIAKLSPPEQDEVWVRICRKIQTAVNK